MGERNCIWQYNPQSLSFPFHVTIRNCTKCLVHWQLCIISIIFRLCLKKLVLIMILLTCGIEVTGGGNGNFLLLGSTILGPNNSYLAKFDHWNLFDGMQKRICCFFETHLKCNRLKVTSEMVRGDIFFGFYHHKSTRTLSKCCIFIADSFNIYCFPTCFKSY